MGQKQRKTKWICLGCHFCWANWKLAEQLLQDCWTVVTEQGYSTERMHTCSGLFPTPYTSCTTLWATLPVALKLKVISYQIMCLPARCPPAEPFQQIHWISLQLWIPEVRLPVAGCECMQRLIPKMETRQTGTFFPVGLSTLISHMSYLQTKLTVFHVNWLFVAQAQLWLQRNNANVCTHKHQAPRQQNRGTWPTCAGCETSCCRQDRDMVEQQKTVEDKR